MVHPAQDANLYSHEALDLTKHQVRLLALKPAPGPVFPIQCDIQVFDVQNAPYYVTLSYVWGPVTPTRFVFLNGKRMPIRKNLFDFLVCFRNDASNVHFLWIDQLCIAQTHEIERNNQVRLMSRIYRRCLYVIVWLGKTSHDAALSFTTTPTEDSAYRVFHNTYFTRLWTVQEILLAPQVRVFCGPIWTSLDALVAVMRSGSHSEYPKFFDSVFGDSNIIRDPELRGLLPLADCVRRFSKYECSDPRDKVYGLLGLVLENQRPVVDYNKSAEGVIADVLMIMSELHWHESKISHNIPNTRVPTRYWLDATCLTRLAKDMGLEAQCQPISYLVEEIYEVIAVTKASGSLGFPIQAIGYSSCGGTGQWWYENKGERYCLLDFPRVPAWARRGLSLLPTGIPDRFQPHPPFHLDGTPWV